MAERRSSGRHVMLGPGPALASGVLALVLTIACGGGSKPGPAPTPVPATGGLGSVQGSYVRPPAHDRVVIFVNGIFGDGIGTWTNSKTGKYWPTLLANDPDFAGVDVYVHSFVSPHLSTAQQILELAGRMRDLLETDRVIANHKELVFLCHSMGGLVTRAFLLNARLPPSKVPMIFFFATPTGGANVAALAAHISANPQLVDMKPLEDGGYVKDLREQWLNTADEPALDYPNKIASFCAYELKDTWSFRVVEEGSAILLCNHGNRAVLGDHLEIVKPADERDDPYVFFKAAYERQFSQEAAPVRNAFAMRMTNPLTTASRVVSLGQFKSASVVLKQVKATRESIAAGCGEVRKGTLEAKVDLEPGETVSEVKADVANASGLKSSSAAVVRTSNGTATVSYSLRGDCPGGGHADVIVNFVVSREPQVVRPGTGILVHPVTPEAIPRPGVEMRVTRVPPARPLRERLIATPGRPSE